MVMLLLRWLWLGWASVMLSLYTITFVAVAINRRQEPLDSAYFGLWLNVALIDGIKYAVQTALRRIFQLQFVDNGGDVNVRLCFRSFLTLNYSARGVF